MGNFYYLVHVHSNCIEGICLTMKNNNAKIYEEIFDSSQSKKEIIKDESNLWIKNLEYFLDQHKLRGHPIAFILPAEEITFRKIKFPFQEKKKVEQALPFELEEELISDLSDSTYCTKVNQIPEQSSEALVLLMGSERLNQLQKLCFTRELLIRNIDCAAYALFRTINLNNNSQDLTKDLFQIYLGSEEAFINTIKDGRLDEIKIFPNRISEILQKQFITTKKTLQTFLKNFSKSPDVVNQSNDDLENDETFFQLKQELQRLCSQFTMYLRVKNFSSRSQIETYGVFGPLIKWDGLVFRRRPFPLPEAETFSERYGGNSSFLNPSEIELNSEEDVYIESSDNTPNTLQELMAQAKKREKSIETKSESFSNSEINFSKDNFEKVTSESNLESINPRETILSMVKRKHWGILGDLYKHAEIFLEPHDLTLFRESTPWRLFLKRNTATVTITASLLIIIFSSFAWLNFKRYNLLKEEVIKAEFLVTSEIKKALPESSENDVNKMLLELKRKINNRKSAIKISKKFEKREYRNLNFLKNVSTLLNEDSLIQVDSLEYSPERFSISGTIDSYDQLQIFKNKLKGMNDFKGKRILESNRKSPDGIVYRILIELN